MAGRKEKHTIDYFPHYVNHKKTMHIIEQKYGNNGYAFWFKLLELLGKSEHHIYDMTTEESSLYFYSQVNTTEATGKEVLEMLARLNAIDQELYESGYIYSEKFCENIHDAYRKRSAEMLNKAEVIQLYRISTGRNSINSARNTQRKVKYSKVKETKEKKSKDMSGKIQAVIGYLNQILGTAYRIGTGKTRDLIKARINEGHDFEDFKTVIDKKTFEWKDDLKYKKFLRPETLFGNKFEGYLNQLSNLPSHVDSGYIKEAKEIDQMNNLIRKYENEEIGNS